MRAMSHPRPLAVPVHGRLLLGHNWAVRFNNPHYYSKSGNLKGIETWEDVILLTTIGNLVPDAAVNDVLDVHFAAGSQHTNWYIVMMGTTPTVAAADTMSSHAGWSEESGYDETNRVAWTAGSVSSKSVDNSASPATQTVTSDSTVFGGAGLTSDNTKDGTSGTFYAGGAFSGGDVTLNAAATIDITGTFSGDDDGA